MNRLVARTTHPKMSASILDHVSTLAILLEAKFHTVAQEEQRQNLRQQQVESSSFSNILQRSLKIQRKRLNYRLVFPATAKSITRTPRQKAISI